MVKWTHLRSGFQTTQPRRYGDLMHTEPKIISLGHYRFDPGRNVLSGAASEAGLSPLAGRLLQFMAAQPGLVVEREELIDALWDGNYLVGDPALTRLVSETRKLAQQVGGQPLIETVHRRGYRLVCAEPADADADGTAGAAPGTSSVDRRPHWRRWAGWLLLAVLAIGALEWLLSSLIGLAWVVRQGGG